MKNSQYTNQANINCNELVRIQFNEQTINGEVVEIVVLSMMPAAAESLAEAILKTIQQHKQNVENQLKTLNTDKELN
jgi:predicted sugar kinase